VEEARRDAGVSDPDVDVVRAAMEAFRRRDAAALYELQDPAFEFRSALAALAGGNYSGPGHLERYFADVDEQLEGWHTEDERYAQAADGRVLVVYRAVGRGRQSGIPVDREIAIRWTLRDGRLLLAETFLNPADALADTGLEEIDSMRKVNEAVSNGDVQGTSRLLHPDVVWEHNLGVGSPEEGVYRGREAVTRLFERILEPWEYLVPEPDHVRALGDGRLVVTGSLRAKHSTSETVIVVQYEQRLEVRDGLLVRGRMTTGEMAPSGNPPEPGEEAAHVE
jgi:ketosteroid isomerase-like protein